MSKKGANYDGEPTNLFQQTMAPATGFFNDAGRLIRKCTKPDAKELKQSFKGAIYGFLMMGVFGYAIKLVFIPVNNVLIGA